MSELDDDAEEFKGFGKRPDPKLELQEPDAPEPLTAEESVTFDDAVSRSDRFKRLKDLREEELDKKIQRVREEEELLATDPSVGAVPEAVANRMITRIAAFFGIPVFGGLGIFVGAYVYSIKTDTVIPPNLIAYATQTPFVLGLIGITYGILSSSWDDEPGSLLGFKEASTNFGRIQEGLKRTADTASLKDEIETEKKKLGRKD
jgi:hypothetical protein